MSLNEEIGQRASQMREAQSLSQQTVADRMGVSQQLVARLEKGREARWNSDHLAAAAEALGCRPRDLLPGEDGDELSELERLVISLRRAGRTREAIRILLDDLVDLPR